MKAGWVNGLNWLNWGEKSIMHKMLGGDVEQVWIILLSRLARALWIEILKVVASMTLLYVEARESLADQKIPVSP